MRRNTIQDSVSITSLSLPFPSILSLFPLSLPPSPSLSPLSSFLLPLPLPSLSLSADSGASGRVRKQLDSLAASSEYGSDDDSTAPPTGARSRVTRPLRRLYRRLQRCATCHPSCCYIVDPKGD